MKVAIRETFGRDTYHWCMAHRLDLCAKDAAKEEDVKPLLEKVKDLAAYFKRSGVAADALRQAQPSRRVPLKMLQSCATRWNSTYKQLQGYQDLGGAISAALQTTKKTSMLLNEHEEDQLAKYIQVLKPFYEATMETCAETLVTGSKVIPIIALMKKSLEDEFPDGCEFQDAALKAIDKRFGGE